MSFQIDSQVFESFVPVYDTVPETWDAARPFLVEQLKKISNGVNARTIGFYLDQQLLSGNQFIPVPAMWGVNSSDSQQFRQIFRKVVDCSPLTTGSNTYAHGIIFDVNFTLIDLWVAATNSSTFNAVVITDDNVTMNATNIVITSPGNFDRAFCVIEYLLEI
jgi:hypothetical protein